MKNHIQIQLHGLQYTKIVKIFLSILFAILSVILLSCSGNKEEPLKPLELSKKETSFDFIGKRDTDTIFIISGNGGYRLELEKIWGWFPVEPDEPKPEIDSLDDYIKVYVEGDKIIAERGKCLGDNHLSLIYHVIDARRQSRMFFVLSYGYTTGDL